MKEDKVIVGRLLVQYVFVAAFAIGLGLAAKSASQKISGSLLGGGGRSKAQAGPRFEGDPPAGWDRDLMEKEPAKGQALKAAIDREAAGDRLMEAGETLWAARAYAMAAEAAALSLGNKPAAPGEEQSPTDDASESAAAARERMASLNLKAAKTYIAAEKYNPAADALERAVAAGLDANDIMGDLVLATLREKSPERYTSILDEAKKKTKAALEKAKKDKVAL